MKRKTKKPQKFSIDINDNILILGASKELKTRKMGKIIDSYDIVCRINNGGNHELLNNKYKDIIGTKKNIWFCLEPFGLRRNKASLVNKFDIVFINHKNIYNEFKSKYKNLRYFPTEITKNCKNTLYSFNKTPLKYEPTSGMKAIFYFITHFQQSPLEKGCMGTIYNNIHLYGFDGFQSGHWYGNKFIKNQDESDANAVKGLGRHNLTKEFEYVKYLNDNNFLKMI